LTLTSYGESVIVGGSQSYLTRLGQVQDWIVRYVRLRRLQSADHRVKFLISHVHHNVTDHHLALAERLICAHRHPDGAIGEADHIDGAALVVSVRNFGE